MSIIRNAVNNDIQLLKLARDELELQAHLFKAEVMDKWIDLEEKWGALEAHAAKVAAAGENAESETKAAIKLLSETLHAGYLNIRNALQA